MFVKIKDYDVLKVENINRMVKNQEIEYELTEKYKKYLEDNRNLFNFFSGEKYTDVVVNTTYSIDISTTDITTEDGVITYSFDTEADRDKTFNAIWTVLEKAEIV